MALKRSLSALTRNTFSLWQCKEKKRDTDPQVFLPGNGGLHAIFLPRQKRHARGGLLSGKFLDGKELRPIDGDFSELRRNSVGVGAVWHSVACDALDGLALLCSNGSGWLCSDNRSRRMTAIWLGQLLGRFRVGGFIWRFSWRIKVSGERPDSWIYTGASFLI